jgi:neutral amino acid transport system ATP-binding protein
VSDSALLRMHAVDAGYLPDVPILNELSIHVEDGELVTLVGPNGAGKSTVLRTVIGLLKPTTGSVSFDGRDISGSVTNRIVRGGIGYVPQRDNVFGSLTVEENLELGLLALAGPRPARRFDAIYDLFPRLGQRRGQQAGSLSGGERQMVAIARTLLGEPRLILLDEPSAGLAPVFVDALFDTVKQIHAGGRAILMVEQNARRALEISDRGYVLDLGRARFEGPGPKLAHDPQVANLYLGGGR